VPVWLCRDTALHAASSNGHTKTAMALAKAGADVHCKDNEGYGFSGCILVPLGSPQCWADGPWTRGGAAGVAVLAVQNDGAAQSVAQRPHGDGDGAGQGGRGRALQGQQGVRCSGCVLVSSVCRSAGRTVRPLGAELRERLFWLCRRTALHLTSWFGHTETAMALAKAGADVHCKELDVG
jgi:hypothetical protein